jgi:hypothetical protein
MARWTVKIVCSALWLAVILTMGSVPSAEASDAFEFEYAWRVDPLEFGTTSPIVNPGAADFDGDGRTDIISRIGFGAATYAMFQFQTAGGERPDPQLFRLEALTNSDSIVGTNTADLDGDGRAEWLLTTTQGLIVVRVGADRSFSAVAHPAPGRVPASPPVAMDVDGDGHQDVVSAEAWTLGVKPREISIRYGDGTGAFPRSRLVPTGQVQFSRFEPGDINSDGHVDLVAYISGGNLAGPRGVRILFGDGQGSFRGMSEALGVKPFDSVFVGDMNEDGRDDVIAVNPVSSDFRMSAVLTESWVYHQDAGGNLPATPVRFALAGITREHELVDLDADGRLDVAEISQPGDPVLAYRIKRDGVFEHRRTFWLPYMKGFGLETIFLGRDYVAYGDFNGDGTTDAVVVSGARNLVMIAGRKRPPAPGVSPPGPPRNVVASEIDFLSNVRVDFQPPVSDGGSPITRYVVISEPDSATVDFSFEWSPLSLSREIFGQVNGQTYRYRVRAYNAAGPGPLSEPSAPFTVRRLPHISINSNAGYEPTTGTRPVVFTVNLSEPALAGGVTFDVATLDGTAVAGQDFVPLVRTGVHIPEGQRSVAIEVMVLADSLAEFQEYFDLRISNVVGAKYNGHRASTTIGDPILVPTIPTVQVMPPSVLEGNVGATTLRFPIEMRLVSSADVSFDIATQPGTAASGVDFLPASTRIVIPAGQTSAVFDVQVIPDVVDENNEFLSVFVSGLEGANVFSPTTTGTILDDDSPVDGIPDAVPVLSEKGFLDLEFQYLHAPTARLSGTAMSVPVHRQVLLGGDATPSLPFDGLASGATWVSLQVPANPSPSTVEVRVLAMASSGTAGQVSLFVGEGNTPTAGSTRCTRDAAGRSQVCELVIAREAGAPEALYWALAQNAQASGAGADIVELELGAVAMVPVNGELVVSAQGVASGAAFTARVGWDIPSLLPGERRLGYVLVESEPGQVVYNEPIRLHRTGDLDAPHVLAQGEHRWVRLEPGDSHERMVFDVPVNAQSVTFALEGEGELSLFASHDAQPSSPVIAPAPPRAAADAMSASPGGTQSITLSGAQLKTGRWHVTPMNRGTGAASAVVRVDVASAGARPALRPGHYYNPDRPGHGLFLDFAGEQWLMVWYTYLQNGRATWYYTQGVAPPDDQAQWAVDLLRVSRGETTRAVRVGSATLTTLEGTAGASPGLAFGYNLDGDAGWETLTRLGDDQCPMYGGQKLDATGHWFPPLRPGHGFSAQILPYTEVYAAYIYDAGGFPTWLIGQKDYDPTVTSVTLQQLSGFCPTCALVPLQSKVVGQLERTLGMVSSGDGQPGITSIEIGAVYEAPLRGVFYGSEPPVMLSQRKGCD